MWNRIEYGDWVTIIPIIAFVLTFSVFVILVTRALLMKKPQAIRLAHLPLEERETPAPGPTSEYRPGGQPTSSHAQRRIRPAENRSLRHEGE